MGVVSSWVGVVKVQGGGDRGPAWVTFYLEDTISMEAHWREDGVRGKALTASLTDMHLEAMRERGEGQDRLVDGTRDTRALGRYVDMTVGLSQMKLEDCDSGWRTGHRDGEK